MANKDAKKELVDFLDRKAFQPVLEASPEDYDTEEKKQMLKDVQRATRSERDRYRNDYDSAEDVRDNFQDDLSSDEAKEVEQQLEKLHLPTLRSVEREFDQKCKEVGVNQ